jgi:hypothetical protein
MKNLNKRHIIPVVPPLPLLDEKGAYNYMSTPKVYGLLCHLVGETEGPYLEVGCYRGQALVAVASKYPKVQCLGVDNFTGVGYLQANEGILREQIAPYKNIKFLRGHYRKAFVDKGGKYGVIFLDGPHAYAETLDQIMLAHNALRVGGYMVIDDINYDTVSKALVGFLMSYDAQYELILRELTDGRQHPEWWNGVAVIQKTKEAIGKSDEEE